MPTYLIELTDKHALGEELARNIRAGRSHSELINDVVAALDKTLDKAGYEIVMKSPARPLGIDTLEVENGDIRFIRSTSGVSPTILAIYSEKNETVPLVQGVLMDDEREELIRMLGGKP